MALSIPRHIMNTKLIELLLTCMSLNSINKKDWNGETPLDNAYYNKSPIKQKIIKLIRSKGGKRENGCGGCCVVS